MASVGGDAAIFRVSEIEAQSGTVVIVDGPFVGDHVRVTEDCCSRALAAGARLSVLLRDVSAIDDAGRDLLCRLAGHGVRLHASRVYISHLVKAIQYAANNPGPAESVAKVRRGQPPG